eukprot:2108328-Alexandrium_andersonii.AAC.1
MPSVLLGGFAELAPEVEGCPSSAVESTVEGPWPPGPLGGHESPGPLPGGGGCGGCEGPCPPGGGEPRGDGGLSGAGGGGPG